MRSEIEKNAYSKQTAAEAPVEKKRIAQPTRSVKDERLRRACGILDRPRRLRSAEVKSLRGKLCQSELSDSGMGCSQTPFSFRQSRTRP